MRNKKIWVFGIIVCLFVCVGVWAYENLSPFERNQEWMELKTAEKRWGKSIFSEEKFRNASMSDRAKMTVSLIESKKYIGKDMAEVKNALGPYTGYFFSDHIAAYQIYAGWKTNENTWNIVFLPGLNGKIKDIRIHKNCCSDVIWKEKGLTPPKN